MSDIFFTLFYFTYMLVVLSTVVYVVLDNRNPVKAMAWILVLCFLPLVGLILYFFLGRSNRKERLISRKGYSRLIKRPMSEYQMQESLKVNSDKTRIMSFFRKVNNALADSKYHYFLQDHQGNNRVVIDQNGTVEETNHYYPFGGVFASTSSVQPYKYNGKELDTKKGLNWYDYGARHYDAAIGRFATVDPLGEETHSISSYTYCQNNPILLVDPTGCLSSTHTDSLGNVVEVYNDGDLGVYKHNTDFEGTQQELAENYSSTNTAAGGEKMGVTEYWDEFLSPETHQAMKIRIYFDRSFDGEFADYAAQAARMNIITLAKESQANGILDIKRKMGNIGGKFRGKFITSRSLGNYIAGYNAARASISFAAFQKLAGALHIENGSLSLFQMASIILTGNYNTSNSDKFQPPTWGELHYQYRMSRNGWNEGIQ